jgi:DNA-binding transcriptional MerR regulator
MIEELDIREVANLSGVLPSRLRFYETKGLIKPVGRNGLRRQYHKSVLNKLQLIVLGQAAGFTLDEMAVMFNTEGRTVIDRELLYHRAKEIDGTIRRLQLLSKGLKHAARCTEPEHAHCEEFNNVVARGLRLIR